MEWQPIETAPKDGTVIDLYADMRLPDCRWFRHYGDDDGGWQQRYSETSNSWFGIDDLNPTHWMPLPEPPNG